MAAQAVSDKCVLRNSGMACLSNYRVCHRRFPEVAGAWAEGLLAGCHTETHGVDLFGRDALLLGRLLTTLVRRTLLKWSVIVSRLPFLNLSQLLLQQ